MLVLPHHRQGSAKALMASQIQWFSTQLTPQTFQVAVQAAMGLTIADLCGQSLTAHW